MSSDGCRYGGHCDSGAAAQLANNQLSPLLAAGFDQASGVSQLPGYVPQLPGYRYGRSLFNLGS